MPCCLQEMEEEKKLEQRRIKDFSGWLQLIRDKRKVCETLNMMQKYQQIADTCIYHPLDNQLMSCTHECTLNIDRDYFDLK